MDGKKIKVNSFLLDFKCISCGKCCKNWLIDISQKDMENISTLKSDIIVANNFKVATINNSLYIDITGKNYLKTVIINFIKNIPFFLKQVKRYGFNIIYFYLLNIDKFFEHLYLMNTKCNFLKKDNMCYIHKTYQESYLPQICFSYPNFCIETANGLEVSFNFSCSQAKNYLTRIDKMEYISIAQSDYKKRQTPQKKIKLCHDYSVIEEKFIKTIQDRDISIQKRIINFGLQLLEINEVETNQETTFENVENLFCLIKECININPRFNNIFNKELNVLEFIGRKNFLYKQNKNVAYSDYINISSIYYKPLEIKFEIILENYLVNLGISKRFATIKDEWNSVDLFNVIAYYYIMIRFLCTCKYYVKEKENFEESSFIDLIIEIERNITHNPVYMHKICQLLREKYTIEKLLACINIV